MQPGRCVDSCSSGEVPFPSGLTFWPELQPFSVDQLQVQLPVEWVKLKVVSLVQNRPLQLGEDLPRGVQLDLRNVTLRPGTADGILRIVRPDRSEWRRAFGSHECWPPDRMHGELSVDPDISHDEKVDPNENVQLELF